MCGIAGFYNLTRSDFVADPRMLDCMQELLIHRGPDASGIWTSDEHQLGLTSRRLSIIDLSAAANQPMQRGDVVAVFNGEIYNYQAVRAALEALGYAFTSGSDTEVIIHGYRAWGIDVLDHLDGMFAIALYDLARRQFFLVRDRLGVKPLYFSVQGGVLSFASEIKALWPLPWMSKHINPLAQYHYLTFMVAPAPLTIFDGVYKLPAGFYAHVDAQRRLSFREWYNPLKPVEPIDPACYVNESACVERIRELLVESTKKRMVADVPVGAFLSGGLDSSLNVALMAQGGQRIKTFTIAIEGDVNDERAWARRVATQFGTEHHELVIGEREAFAFYERMVTQLDEPLADCVCIPFYHVSRLARDAGMKVVQVGEGADELFFGYPTYARYAQMQRVLQRRWLVTPARRVLGSLAAMSMGAQPLKQEFVINWVDKRALFWGGAVAFGEHQKRALLAGERDAAAVVRHDPIVEQIYPGMTQTFDSHAIVGYHLRVLKGIDPMADAGKQMLYLELKQRLPELLLMRADEMSMATSIEAREPFLDYRLVEFMLNVPYALRFKQNETKYLLKKAAEGILSDDIIYRTKVGFGAPTAHWLERGRFFPAYFAQQQGSLLPAVTASQNGNDGHRAVQNWTLQQLQAFERLVVG